jgi:AcrR family transcriptional regulator
MVNVRYSTAMKMSTARAGAPHLSAGDWIRAAMDVIVEGGVGAVAVEPLAARLGATKGSFYHHFENRDALIMAALDDWERSATDEVIARLQLIPDPGERLRAVIAAAIADRPGGARDAALLAAATHPLVRPVVERVTRRRLSYFTEMYMNLGLSRVRARRRALLLYTSYVGLVDYLRVGLHGEVGDTELGAYAEELLGTLVPGKV